MKKVISDTMTYQGLQKWQTSFLLLKVSEPLKFQMFGFTLVRMRTRQNFFGSRLPQMIVFSLKKVQKRAQNNVKLMIFFL